MNRNLPAAMPTALKPGDRIAIVSPASKIAPELIDHAVEMLGKEGYDPVVMPHAKGGCGSFSASAEDRFADMKAALEDDSIRAIICSYICWKTLTSCPLDASGSGLLVSVT